MGLQEVEAIAAANFPSGATVAIVAGLLILIVWYLSNQNRSLD